MYLLRSKVVYIHRNHWPEKKKEKRLLHPSNLCLDVSSSLIEEE